MSIRDSRIARHGWRHAPTFVAILAILFAIVLSGCTIPVPLGSAGEGTPTPTETPSQTPVAAGSGAPSALVESIALIRSAGDPEETLGSAVVMGSDGYLVTSTSALSGDVEIVLPDGQVFRPVLVSTEPATGLALLKVPADRLVPVRFSTQRAADGTEVYATGYDGSPGSVGRMGGQVRGTVEDSEEVDFRVRGPMLIDTDISLVSGFVGGALSDGDGGFSGILIPGTDEDDRTVARAVSNWFVLAWMERRQGQLETMSENAAEWDRIDLPGGWSVRQPDGWSQEIASDDATSYRADFMPADPDANLQFSISVEPNDYGTDAGSFIEEQFEDRSSARIWGMSEIQGKPVVRVAVTQEGALVDVSYLLDDEFLIAISLTSGYRPQDDPAQTDQARALFEAVVGTLDR